MTMTLYHCMSARSFRPLWMLEELGLPYKLEMLPFPPRSKAPSTLKSTRSARSRPSLMAPPA